jgi:hypothetical protein
MSDDRRSKSIERAKSTGKLLVGLGLNALLPGVGSTALRLGEHISSLVRDDRLARLDEFHRDVFAGDVADDVITERFRAMQDGDFQYLLTTMLADIEAAKVGLYSAVYIHLVEHNNTIAPMMKQTWVLAASQLRLLDVHALQNLVREPEPVGTDNAPDPTEQRLMLVGAVIRHMDVYDAVGPQQDEPWPHSKGDHIESYLEVTEFGRDFMSLAGPAVFGPEYDQFKRYPLPMRPNELTSPY